MRFSVSISFVGVTHLRQLRRLDLFDLEEIPDGQEGDGHCTDTDHKDDQRWTVVDVAPQVLYRVQQVHLRRTQGDNIQTAVSVYSICVSVFTINNEATEV